MKKTKMERLEHLGLGNIDMNSTDSYTKPKLPRGKQLIKYDFVWNNYKDYKLERLETFLKSICKRFVFQEEIGESGTHHLQGCIWLKKRARITELVSYDELKHCSFRQMWTNWKCLSKYCQQTISDKPFGRIENGRVFRHNVKKLPKAIKIIDTSELYDWEREIIDIIIKEPDDRSIYWYWEKVGGKGKSTFCKYLTIKHNAIVLSGKAADMKYGIVKYIEKHGDYPECIILDIPRSMENFISYQGIEQIKNALFFSTKYESDMVVGNAPHVICFANFEPDLARMSADRWRLRHIGDIKKEVKSIFDFSDVSDCSS